MSKEMEDQQIEAYIGALDEDWADTEDDVVLTNEALEALVDADAVTKHVIRKTRIDDNDGDDANEINGTIIMDADGNYYFHTSKGAIEVKPLKYKNPSKVLKMKSATVVKQGAKRITSYDSKRTAEKRKLSHSKKSVDDHVNVHDSNNDCQAIKTSEYTSHQSDDLKSYELIIPETEAEFCSINNTSGTSEQQYPEHQQQQQQQDGTTATQVAFNAMTIYYCKYCTFKTNNEQLLENHLETCEKTKEIAKKQDEEAKKKEENKVKVEDKGNPVKRKVGRPRKKFTPPRLTTAIKSEEAQKFSQKKKLKDSKCKKSDNQIRHNQNETGNKTVNDTINETVNDTVNDNDTYIDMSTTEDPDYVPQNDVAVRTEAFIKSFNKGCSDTANDKERKCPQCPYTTMKKFAFSRHLKTHSDDRPYKCSICEKGFKTNASLQNHVNTHLGKKPHLCNDCGKSFTTSGELVRHSRYRHTGVRPHKCTECDYASVEMSKLKRHMRCHTGERPYQCPHCTYASPDSFKLKRHLRTHTGEKPYECDICHARFTQSNSLKYHRLIHSVNEKPVFQCPMCPTTCGRKTDLRLHVQNLHSTDKTWPCNRCGKELPDRYSFKMHIKTHEGEKCFQCKYCPYASVMQRHLTIHMLLHTDEKPFKCETCEMPFRQKMLLQRHINVYHSNNYVPPKPREKTHACPHCDKAFCFKGNLIRHMEVHDPSAAVEQRQFELKIGRLVRIMSDKDNTNSSNIKESNERDDRERFSESNIDNNGKKEIIDDYNIDVDINEALMESFPDQDEMEYQKEVAEDENCEEEEAYYLYEEIEDDEADEDVLEEQLKPSLLINSIKRVQLNNTTTKGATGQSIQQYQQKIPKKMSKLVLKKNKDNSVLAEHQPINVKVEKETSLSDNVVVIEIVQCNDEALIGHEGNGNGQEAREDEEERVVIQEMLERGGTSDDIEMIATNQHTIEEKKIKRKQKWKQPNLSAIEILDNDKNITVDNCFDFEEDGEVTLVSDANGRTIEFFEITEAI